MTPSSPSDVVTEVGLCHPQPGGLVPFTKEPRLGRMFQRLGDRSTPQQHSLRHAPKTSRTSESGACVSQKRVPPMAGRAAPPSGSKSAVNDARVDGDDVEVVLDEVDRRQHRVVVPAVRQQRVRLVVRRNHDRSCSLDEQGTQKTGEQRLRADCQRSADLGPCSTGAGLSSGCRPGSGASSPRDASGVAKCSAVRLQTR